MCLLYSYDQGFWFFTFCARRPLHKLHVPAVNTSSQQIRNKNIGSQISAVTAEFQTDMLATFQECENLVHRIVSGRLVYKSEPLQPRESSLQRDQRLLIHINLLSETTDPFSTSQRQEFLKPTLGTQVSLERVCSICSNIRLT